VIRREPDSPTKQAIALAYRVLGKVHARTGGAAVWALAFAERTLGRVPWSCRLGSLAAVLAVGAIYLSMFGQEWLIRSAELTATDIEALESAGLVAFFGGLRLLAWGIGWVLVLGAVAAFVRVRLSALVLRIGAAGFAVVWGFFLLVLVRAPSELFAADAKMFDKYTRNEFWIAGTGLWLLGVVPAVLLLLSVVLRSVSEFYGGRPRRVPLGDRIVANLKTHGKDPRFRTSSYWSGFLHLLVLVIVPVCMRSCGMEAAYGVPKGSGNPVVQMVKIRRIKKKKKKKKFVLNMDSPIIFHHPKIDESDILKQVEEDTLDTYVASSLQTGKPGKGGGRGGWPSGMENARVRFIRLEYRGGDWDQDMGVGADYNLLIQFRKMTNFKIADNTEHLSILRLRRFPKHRGPPFVFITGSGRISVTRREIKTLRWYCLEEGGMIFADNGGGTFNSSFRSLMRRCFPELDWVDIASDDIIYRQPYVFPNGAPPLWHHSGNRALGLKHNGRWICFYHQGDVNDAWKTGHSGVSEGHAMQAYRLGVNVINYSFNQYMRIHYGD